jgi:hypothetical protein
LSGGFLDVAGAAKFFCRSPRWVRGKLREGIPHYRPGGQILFLEADLLKWMQQFKVVPEPVDLKGLIDKVVRRTRGETPRVPSPGRPRGQFS